MSTKQWGHGFHTGTEKGIESGSKIGTVVGAAHIGEYAWHSVSAALDALRDNDDLRAMMLLKTLRFQLASVTGRDRPEL